MTSKRHPQLKQLHHVLTLKSETVQAELAQLARRQREIECQLNSLRDDVGGSVDGLSSLENDTVWSAKAQLAWQRWADQLREVLNTTLARTLAEKAEVTMRARIAIGQEQVIKKLIK